MDHILKFLPGAETHSKTPIREMHTPKYGRVFLRKDMRLRQARRPWGGRSAHAIAISYRYTDTLQVYRHPTNIQYPEYKSRHPKYKSRRPNTSPDTQNINPDKQNTNQDTKKTSPGIYKWRHTKYKSRLPKAKSRHPKCIRKQPKCIF